MALPLLSLRELDVFRRVMELGSITAAAQVLRISQPAASRLIQQAEERLGFPLFLRQKKRLIPTSEAQALFPETVGAFAALDSVQRFASELKSGQSGRLTIAAIPALANALVPQAVQQFRKQRSGVSVKVLAVSAHDCGNLVSDQRADLGLIIGPMTNPGVTMTELCKVDIGCALPARHPLAKKAELRPADLRGAPLIGLSPHLPLGVQVGRTFAEANIPLQLAMEVTQSTIALALVRAQAGIALLDGFAFHGPQAVGLVFRPLRPASKSVARILLPRHRPASRLALEFSEQLQTAAKDLRFAGGN
jgi:DNA-binding transcriptional LysR family regulator